MKKLLFIAVLISSVAAAMPLQNNPGPEYQETVIWRQTVRSVIAELQASETKTPERRLAIQRLEEAQFWLGRDARNWFTNSGEPPLLIPSIK